MAGKKNWLAPFVLGIIGVLAWFFYQDLLLPPFLTFSDAAKFADIARNFVLGLAVDYLFGIEYNFLYLS